MGRHPIPIVLVMVTHGGDVLLIRRNKEPYKGYWTFVGGKLENDETITEASVREAKEETGLDVEFREIKAVFHERLKEGENLNFSGIIFLTHAEAPTDKFTESDEGELRWVKMDSLDEMRMIPQDRWMGKNFFDKSVNTIHFVVEEKNGEVNGFREV
ncbi:MAG: NUDIX domain-containing protein [Candidatus Aenigmarchaeota archaeon]|nr:NUDIX domain-containing protein [Candidatus Aenigmarchaeota archaeon]